ncbi:MAG: LysR family transcriptional regulator [Bacteroidia bacterium]
MNYTLQQLKVFVKVVECRSVTKAAGELFMTQPAVSIQLRNFQDQFEIPLTEIIGRQLRVTDFGFEIYRMTERVLNEVNSINYKTQAYKGLLSGRLIVASVSTGKYVMPFFLAGFMKQHQGIDLVMDVTNKEKVIDSLESGDIDFALVSVLPEKLDIHEETLMDNELHFVANKSFVVNKNKMTREDLENQPLIYREQGSATRKVMEDYFAKKNIHARKKLELTSNEAVKQAIIAGLGISIMPLIGIRDELNQKKNKDITLRWIAGKNNMANNLAQT